MSAPDLSVIIVTYDCRDLALACLETLRPQQDDLDVQVLLLDNDSRDGTLEAVRAQHPWVVARSAGGNVGFSKANNIGLAEAAGRHVLLLNPDTLVPPGALAASVAELERRPDIGMLGCRLVKPDGTLDHACKRGFPTPANAFWYFTGMARLRPRDPRFAGYTAGQVDEHETSRIDAVNGAFMLVRREALEAVGGLDERYWMYGEDLDWCRRFWDAGWPVLYWPGVDVVHIKGGSSSNLRGWRSNLAFHRAMWRFYSDHYAAGHAAPVTWAMWAGIHGKLVISAARSLVLRRLAAR